VTESVAVRVCEPALTRVMLAVPTPLVKVTADWYVGEFAPIVCPPDQFSVLAPVYEVSVDAPVFAVTVTVNAVPAVGVVVDGDRLNDSAAPGTATETGAGVFETQFAPSSA